MMQAAAMSMPIGFGKNADPLLQRAYGSYLKEWSRVEALAPAKLEIAEQYDIEGMNRAVAICHWGRSGSFLLASYLDDHPEVVSLPAGTGESIYPFYLQYESLSMWEKLVAYPAYSAAKTGTFGDLFLRDNPNGHFAIDAADYYAGVQALFETYGARSKEWLHSSTRFVQFVQMAYEIGVGKRRKNPRPLMICPLHYRNQELAERFIRDFPDGQFIHTIRDPITSVDSWFNWKLDKAKMDSKDVSYALSGEYCDAAVATMLDLLTWDQPHRGMESRTRAIRFEDMHLAPETMMRRLASWLRIPYDPCLIKSTWNGNPYIVNVRGVPCCGANPSNAQRRFKNLSVTDRLMIFALFGENFAEWRYPRPKAIHSRWIRLCIAGVLSLVPAKMELTSAHLVVAHQVLPSLRRGRFRIAAGAMFFLLKRRLRMMLLIAIQASARMILGRHTVLKTL